jgi:phage gpG-like protein
VGLSGSGTAAARALAGRFRKLKVDSGLTRPMAAMATELTLRSFRAQEAPDGGAWAKGPYVSSPMLQKSRKLIGSIGPSSTSTTFSVRARARHAWFHQRGAILRDAAPGSRFRRTRTRRAGKGKEGPKQRLTFAGPVRKGRERGFLPARPVLPSAGGMPAWWEPRLRAVADARLRSVLGF